MCCFQGTTKKFDQEVVKYYTMKLTIEVTREKKIVIKKNCQKLI